MEQQQSQKPIKYRTYNLRMLIALISICTISFLLLILAIDISSISIYLLQAGILCLLGESIGVMVLDWQGAITLRGLAKRYTEYKGQTVDTTGSYVLLYILFPEIMLPFYLTRVVLDYRKRKYIEIQGHMLEIASLEAQLGILPSTEGVCRICQKALIVGAQFCQYCGEVVVERPKICPSCASTASPDANWCPKCRTALS